MTAADFYIGRGPSAQWVGSLSHNARPGILHWTSAGCEVLDAVTALDYTRGLDTLLSLPSTERRNWAHHPANGWPWCWHDSSLTGWCYAFDAGRVWISYFGRSWFPCPSTDQLESGSDLDCLRRSSADGPRPVFPTLGRSHTCAERCGTGLARPRVIGFWELLGLMTHAARETDNLEVAFETTEEATQLYSGDEPQSLLGAVLLRLGVAAAGIHASGLNTEPPSYVFPRFGFQLTVKASRLADDFQVWEAHGDLVADLLADFEESANPYDRDPDADPLTAPPTTQR